MIYFSVEFNKGAGKTKKYNQKDKTIPILEHIHRKSQPKFGITPNFCFIKTVFVQFVFNSFPVRKNPCFPTPLWCGTIRIDA